MKISGLSNTVLLAFSLAGTPLLLAEEDKTSDRCGVCHEQETKENIFRLVVINCTDASFVTRPIWRTKLREGSMRQGMTIYGDWTGTMLQDYQMQDHDSNFLIIDGNGIIRYTAIGLIENGQFEKIKELLLNLANHEG
ncbi:MAG: hypothetical protein ACLPT6_07840 [Desulfobaccales bacterium]